MDNFKIIYKILSILEKSMDLENFNIELLDYERLKISKERFDKILIMLFEAGYIKGVNVHQWLGGQTEVEFSQIAITLEGLAYLAENSLMKKAYNIAKGISDIV